MIKAFNEFLYSLIWSARKEKSLPKWWLVGIIAIVRVFWLPLLIATIMCLTVDTNNTNNSLLFTIVVMSWFFMTPHTIVSFTSSVYSIAADCKRMMNSGKKNVFVISSFLLWSLLAVISALSFLVFKLNHLHWIKTQELDVIGNVISKIKLKWLATAIHKEIEFRYCKEKHSPHNIKHFEEELAKSTALSYKWMAEMYGKKTPEGKTYLNKIEGILTKYPDLEPEVKTRLFEALDRTQEAIEQESLIVT